MGNGSRIDGIGGVFFRGEPSAELTAFYKKHFDITLGDWLHQSAGPAVIAGFKADTDYFGPTSNQFMINFRVSDIAPLIKGLKADGVKELGYDEEKYGTFFRFLDTAGNAIELWQPPKDDLPVD
jgi:glyoxylase I family protein